jgi:hypothetical protein
VVKRTDGMAATYIDSQSPGDAAEPVNLPLFISEPMIKIAQFHELRALANLTAPISG